MSFPFSSKFLHTLQQDPRHAVLDLDIICVQHTSKPFFYFVCSLITSAKQIYLDYSLFSQNHRHEIYPSLSRNEVYSWSMTYNKSVTLYDLNRN